jgi:hypothetical protein
MAMSSVMIDLPDPPRNAPPIEYWIDDYLESLRPTLKEAFQDAFRQWLERQNAKSVEKNPFEMPFEEFEKLSEDKQDEVSWQAFSRNKAWIDEQLRKYDAEWIVVIGGKVQKFSPTLDDVPMRNEMTKMGMETGLVPFLFIREPLIEESAAAPTAQSQWNELEGDDFYPTVPITIGIVNDDKQKLESTGIRLTADLDTGSPSIIVRSIDIEQLGIRLKDYKTTWATHLGQRYRYVTPKVQIAVHSESQGLKVWAFALRVVYDWATGHSLQLIQAASHC